ncbi:MAG: DUF87 domain-containing protein, partial [Candidatus Sungbacteria bacterium]|nr:DUF87 domain-containing protein [Candidatus Sungbacteria bacterium]
MQDSLFILYLYTAGIAVLFFAIGGWVFFYWLVRRIRIQRAMNLVLLSVRLPTAVATEEAGGLERLREKIGVMEQFYSGLSVIKGGGFFSGSPWIALELTVPARSTELSFYIAVPRRSADAVEKLVHAYYPDAAVERVVDYNIFTPDGQVAISHAALAAGQLLPLRTYKTLEADPLKVIASVFTKLDEETEGAALQVVFRPAPSKVRKRILAAAERYQKGEKSPTGGKILKDIVAGPKAKKPEGEPRWVSPADEARGKALQEKAARALFDVNLRLVASAPSGERADMILQSLEQAFLQLNEPNLNSLRFVREKKRILPHAAFEYSFRLWEEKHLMLLSASELTSIYHFPNAPLEVPQIGNLKSRESAPPPDLPKQGLPLGFNVFRGIETPVRLAREDRRRHLYIIGQTGTGKSNFLKTMLAEDIKAGEGLCVIDPHGDLPEYALGLIPDHRIDDVIYFDPGDTERPLGLNMLEYDERFPEQKTLLLNELLAIFDKLFNMSIAGGPQFEQYFRNAGLLVMEDPASGNTLLEIRRVFADKTFRDYKLERCSNILVKMFWTQIAERAGGEAALVNMVPYVTSKFDAFLSSDIMRPIIAQSKSAFDFRRAMDEKKILLIDLSKGRLGETSSALLGLILVSKLLLASLSRTNVSEEERHDFYLYLDEFQNVTTKSIGTMLSEARKYRLNLTLTHQFIGQLEEEIKKAVFG